MPGRPPRSIDRRRFLAAAGALPVGILGLSACARDDSGSGPARGSRASEGLGPDDAVDAGGDDAVTDGSVAPLDADGLPPRVVGLRSLGGAFRYDPAGLLIDPGQAVHWLNMGDFHTVSAFHPDNTDLIPAPVPLRMPKDAVSYHSGMLGLTAGTHFTHRFELEGVYDYFCQPHYGFGMVGRIIVGRALDGPALHRPEDDLIEVAHANMPSVEAITGPGGVAFEWSARVNGVLYTVAHGGQGASAAEAVAEKAKGDDALRSWLGPEGRGALERALAAMVDETGGSADYEALVRRADDVKAVLEGAGESA